MKPETVIEYFGSQTKTATALKCGQSTVSEWVQRGVVPLARQFQVEELSGGALKASRPWQTDERAA